MTNFMVGENFALPYIVPENNIRVEMPVAIVDRSFETFSFWKIMFYRNMKDRSPEARQAAKAFLDYLFTPEAQREFVQCGFRPVNRIVQKEVESEGLFPKVKTLWTVEQKLGGWLAVQEKFFDADKILDVLQTEIAQKRIDLERQRQRGN